MLILGSCDQISFAEPQPVHTWSIKRVPETLRGLHELGPSGEFSVYLGKDFLTIDGKSDTLWLNEDVVVKRYKKQYVISLKNEPMDWDVYLYDPEVQGLKMLALKPRNRQKINDVVGKKVVKFDKDGNLLPLELSKREFRKLMPLFTGVSMDD
jgi:hypothetical protein